MVRDGSGIATTQRLISSRPTRSRPASLGYRPANAGPLGGPQHQHRHTRSSHFEPLTATETRRFLTSVRPHRLQALFELVLRTGLRWEDLDLDNGTASIRRTLQRTRAGGLTTLPTKPIRSERRIASPLNASTRSSTTASGRTKSARPQARAGRRAVSSSPRPTAHPPIRPP